MNINRPFLAALAILPFLEILLLSRLIGQFGFLLTLGLNAVELSPRPV